MVRINKKSSESISSELLQNVTVLYVEQILRSRTKMTIRHAGKNYLLQITKNNELKLT